jgi:hypothetical protein
MVAARAVLFLRRSVESTREIGALTNTLRGRVVGGASGAIAFIVGLFSRAAS